MKIWDLHCHLGLGGRTPDESMARLIALADRMGIERVVVYMGYPHTIDPSPDDLRKENDQVLQALWSRRQVTRERLVEVTLPPGGDRRFTAVLPRETAARVPAEAKAAVLASAEYSADPDLRCDLLEVKRVSGGALMVRWRIVNGSSAAGGGLTPPPGGLAPAPGGGLTPPPGGGLTPPP